MQDYRREFIELAIASDALQFGEFELKSGRVSPYFFNAAAFNTGAALAKLGRCYAGALVDRAPEVDMLFGPAYKGIPLVSATAVALTEHHGRDLPWAFDRKEAKEHGEGGGTVGAPLSGRVMIVDDVISAGTAIRQALAIIREAGAEPAGVLVALDRQERGQSDRSAVQELEAAEGVRVTSIARLDDLVAWLEQRPDFARSRDAVRAYRDRYGAA